MRRKLTALQDFKLRYYPIVLVIARSRKRDVPSLSSLLLMLR